MDENEFEIASNTAERIRAEGLASVRARLAPQSHPDFDGVHCVDCEAKLPRLRLDMGRVRCTDCQDLLDRQQKRKAA